MERSHYSGKQNSHSLGFVGGKGPKFVCEWWGSTKYTASLLLKRILILRNTFQKRVLCCHGFYILLELFARLGDLERNKNLFLGYDKEISLHRIGQTVSDSWSLILHCWRQDSGECQMIHKKVHETSPYVGVILAPNC